MEFLFFCILSVLWPIRMIVQLFITKKLNKNETTEEPIDICQKIMKNNMHQNLLWASSQNYTDMWTRDTFFACMRNTALKKRVSSEFAKYQREDGLIPLYIGKGNACCKLFCGTKAEGPTTAFYTDAKTGDEPTDACFQFIIMAHREHRTKALKAWKYMQKSVINNLIYEQGLGTWQDTIKHKGHVAYTNILYYQATKELFPDQPHKAENIKNSIQQTLWNGKYFVCSTTNSSFGQVDNALALIYGLVPSQAGVQSIFQLHERHFSEAHAPPNKKIDHGKASPAFGPLDVYLPCFPIGNAEYHRSWSWSWVNLLFMKAKKNYGRSYDLSYYNTMIKKYGTLHETYDKDGPIKRLLYISQPDFSESCGLFLEIYDNYSLQF